MGKQYSVADARNQLPALLHEAERGGVVEITRHGRPIAVVVSISDYERLTAARPDLWDAWQAWRSRTTALTDADVDALADPDRGADPGGGVDW
jgi:prevent-host-death family protein